jgi:putative transcriptional regulator
MPQSIDKLFEIKPTGLKPSPGKLLIASPFLHDGYFGRSVVLVVEHNEEGTVGLILNKPKEVTIISSNFHLNVTELKIFTGGPVSEDRMHILHRKAHLIDESLNIVDDLCWGGDFDQIIQFVESGVVKLKDFRFLIGYSGWSAGQLEAELNENSWVVMNAFDWDELLKLQDRKLWTKAVEILGFDYKHWLQLPTHPLDN